MDFDRILKDLRGQKIDPLEFYKVLGEYLERVGSVQCKSSSRLRARGNLAIFKIEDGRDPYLIHQDWNKITNIGFQTIAQMWGEPDSPTSFDDAKPAIIAIGAASSPSTPGASDTALDLEVERGAYDQRLFVGAPTNGVRFERTIPKESSGANGRTITEAGLFRADDSQPSNPGLIARQTFAGIPKNNSFQLLFQWTFTFSEV